jgi:hypothetical protein
MSAIYTASGGPRMTEFLARFPVESQWLAGHHITWTTGQQDRADGLAPETATQHDGAWPSAIALFACKSGLEEDSPQGQSD